MFSVLVALAAQSQGQDYKAKAAALVAQMTLEEKASLCSGKDFWTTKPIERLGIPSIMMTDGPHGLRKATGLDITNSVPATCFPTASALASSWDVSLVTEVGKALGVEAQANDVQILLGPGTNMKRSPLGGRNFEYFSEDPVLAGKLAAAFIRGVQSQGVGTSLKHYAVNNQEYERMAMSSDLDEQTLHEIYLPAFEIAVKESQPWTVMCAYNRINGVYAAENPLLLHDILKEQWGLEGFVVSDWGATADRVAGVKAGLHLEMPASGGMTDKKIVAAVQDGTLDEARLDEIVTELLAVTLKAYDNRKAMTFSAQQHHDLARKVGGECAVLLKNEGSILPIQAGKTQKVAVIGAFAKTPRYQGAGSSQVKPTQIANAYDELSKIMAGKTTLSYAEGYTHEGTTDDAMLAEARKQATAADIAIVFAGLPDSYESEGFDRSNIDMPEGHNQLIEAVAAAQPNTVVVLMNGSAITMPWAAKAKAIVEGWLGGQAGGGALADVLTGKVNPSGKLSETFPQRLEDTPAFLDFPGRQGHAHYGEGLFIGYRYYDKKKIEPLFPFGYGLSYTTFSYTGIQASTSSAKDTETIQVDVKVKNTGKVAGKEIVQLYVHNGSTELIRPEKELKHFAKVDLKPGEETTVRFDLSYRDFAYYDAQVHDWQVNSGAYTVLVGGSSASLPLKADIDIEATKVKYPKFTETSLLKDLKRSPMGQMVYQQMMAGMKQGIMGGGQPAATPEEKAEREKAAAMMEMFFQEMPLRNMARMSQGQFTEEMLQGLLMQLNQ
ncbi:MAG: glycoside hydrolase family 3 C-terminal domain-containing protein [Phaeodactylibacter sp.]|nr:glycoside hydrolase family 3 C-terminal domain-containing protein [Phaeodactylibacter sp.]